MTCIGNRSVRVKKAKKEMELSSSSPFQTTTSQEELLAPPSNSVEFDNANDYQKDTTNNALESHPMDYCEVPISEYDTTVATVPPISYYYAEPGSTDPVVMQSMENGNYYFHSNSLPDPSKTDYYPSQQNGVSIPIQHVIVQVPESNNHSTMFHIGVTFAVISWILQLLSIAMFSLICIVVAQIILWSNYNSYRNSAEEIKRTYAQKSRKMAITHLIVCMVFVVIDVIIVTLVTFGIIAAYIVVYVVAIVTASSSTTR